MFFQCVNLEQLNLRRTIRSRKRIRGGGGGLGGGRPSVIFRPSALPHLISYPYTLVCRIRLPVLGVFSQCGREKTAREERNNERGKTAGKEKRRTCKHQSAHCPTDFLKTFSRFTMSNAKTIKSYRFPHIPVARNRLTRRGLINKRATADFFGSFNSF